jgi:monoamine oxidase
VNDVRVVIVGAGISGLRAAVEFGSSYVVLEAMNRVGGRTLSTSSLLPTEDDFVEHGAAWSSMGQ